VLLARTRGTGTAESARTQALILYRKDTRKLSICVTILSPIGVHFIRHMLLQPAAHPSRQDHP